MFGRGGPFGSMFGSDPFFSDPFSHMNRMMSSMLSDPFFANPFDAGLQPAGVHHVHPAQPAMGRQPVIEEVDDTGHAGRAAVAQDEPIVEEPDDEQSPQDRASQRQRRHSPPRQPAAQSHMAPIDPFSQLFGAFGGMGSGGSSFMISSSSYSSMGPRGVAYQASSTTRVGPGGVRETQSVVRDGRSGTEAVTISRGLGDGRQRTLVRTRDAIRGVEEQLEDLQGLREHEAEAFDEHWRQHAERNLPGGGNFGAVSGRLAAAGGGRGAAGQQRPLALPHAPSTAPAVASAVPSSSTAGLYDNTGFSVAQRATYAQPQSHNEGRGWGQAGGSNAAVGVSSRGALHNSASGSSVPRSRGAVLDKQITARQQRQPQAHPIGVGMAGPNSGAEYPAGGSYTHQRNGY